MRFLFRCDDAVVEIDARHDGQKMSITLPDGEVRTIDDATGLLVDGSTQFDLPNNKTGTLTRYCIPVAHTERGVEISYLGRTYVFTEPSTAKETARNRTISASSGSLTSPMVGILSEIFVAVGDAVEAFQPLAIVEAMKVMATIEAPFAGAVKHVYAEKGNQLAHGAPVIDIEPVDLIPDPKSLVPNP